MHDSTELAVSARNISRYFGDLKAVDEVNLRIEKGTVYGFLGPNGSGKSTTIRMLCGLLIPSSGTIEVMGLKVPQQVDRLRAAIGYMTQRFSLYTDLTIRENLRFIASIYGLNRTAANARIDELLVTYNLSERAAQLAGTLSGGQKQRLALAAAVMHKPKMLFLDEPTSAVDPENRRDFWENLFDLSAAGTTILVSTHLMDEAERCHRLAILSAGRIVADGIPHELTAELSGQTLGITTPRPRRLRDVLLEQGAVRSAAQVGNQLRVLVEAGSNNAINAIRDIMQAHDLSGEVAAVAPNLEDVFVVSTSQSQRQ